MAVPPAPDAESLERTLRWTAPWEKAFRVELSGAEHIPRGPGPVMFVGNHQLLALDSPLLVAQVWRTFGVPLRPLIDDLPLLPPVGRWYERAGCVRASRDNARELLAQDAWLLVYPGGAREAVKADGHRYELDWDHRLGFAELALERRCTVVPLAARGIDGAFRVLLSAERMLASPLGRWMDGLGLRRDLVSSVVVPARFPHVRFRLCEPIETDHFLGHDHATNCRRLRAEVGTALQHALQAMAEHPEGSEQDTDHKKR